MSIHTTSQPTQAASPRRDITRRMVQVVLTLTIMAVGLFASAGTVRWFWAWVYVAASVALVAVNVLVLPRDVIAERGKRKENVKEWDRKLTLGLTLLTVAMIVVAGLDFRFAWSRPYPAWIHWAALALLVAGQLVFTWAMTANHFFSTAVRIQSERGHSVASGGPYRFVRHPGYAGTIVATLAMPILLGSLWALLPAAGVSALYVFRTAREDQMLQTELPGYAEFAQRTRFRLLPGVW